MTSPLLWQLCGLVVVVAIAAKGGGCMLAARCGGLSWRDSTCIGVLMNTRGLMELIVLNVGYDLGVIPKSVFFMLTVMAVVTTYMTAPLLRRLFRATEFDLVDPAWLPAVPANAEAQTQ
jgi:Kef-type K+ transport system membrane component KefB